MAHNCRIIPIRVTYTRDGNEIWDDDWVVSAINHAWEDDGADVLSCSWRYLNVVAINNEINNALISGRNNLGCIIVFASGNFNSTVSYPANSNPDIIAVGAMSPCGQRKRSSSNSWEVNPGVSTDPQGVSCDNEKWWGSNYGNELDLIAPGVFIPTTDIQGSAGYNTTSGTGGNYHQTFNGTSSATPHVAGVTALILSINPGLTQDQVRDIIESTCTKVGNYSYSTVAGRTNGTWDDEVGYGLVNAYAAVHRVLGGPITGPSFICTSGTTFSITPPAAFDSIVWTCGPSLAISSGQNTASCNLSVTGNGGSWVRARLVSACGSVTLPQKTVWVGTPQNSKISAIVMMGPSGNQLCRNTEMTIAAGHSEATAQGVTKLIWDFGAWAPYFQYFDIGGNLQDSRPVFRLTNDAPASQNIKIYAQNTCGYNSQYYQKVFYAISCGGYYLAISPNPATGETTLSLVNESTDATATLTEWDYEIYDSSQGLKEKKTKLKTTETKINTSNWKEGVYIVRAIVGDKIITEKLVVKH